MSLQTQISNWSQCFSTCGVSISKAIKIQLLSCRTYACFHELKPQCIWIELDHEGDINVKIWDDLPFQGGEGHAQRTERWKQWWSKQLQQSMLVYIQETRSVLLLPYLFYQYCLAEECVDDNSFFLFNIYMLDRKW